MWHLNSQGSWRHATNLLYDLEKCLTLSGGHAVEALAGGGVSLLWMPNEKHLPAVAEIHLSVDLPFPIKPASSRSGWEAVRGGKNRKTTTINEVLHWEITMCALPDSICTSLMACAIMWASINIEAGTVSAKGFTSVTAAPPLQMSREGIYMKYSGIVSQSRGINSCRGIRSNSGPCIEKLWKNKSDLNERPCWETSRGNILSFEFSNFWNLKKWRGSKEKRREGWREEWMDVAVNPETLSLFLFVYRR